MALPSNNSTGIYSSQGPGIYQVHCKMVQSGKLCRPQFSHGAATMAAAVGIEDSSIQALGRWSSAAFQSYIQLSSHSIQLKQLVQRMTLFAHFIQVHSSLIIIIHSPLFQFCKHPVYNKMLLSPSAMWLSKNKTCI